MSTTTIERDPEAVCACGHHRDEHAETPTKAWHHECRADRCTCRGYRLGGRFRYRHRA